jgi:hypothetical protein
LLMNQISKLLIVLDLKRVLIPASVR